MRYSRGSRWLHNDLPKMPWNYPKRGKDQPLQTVWEGGGQVSKVAGNVIGWSVLALIALGVGFLATHHHESYNCHRNADDVIMCDFRYVGN